MKRSIIFLGCIVISILGINSINAQSETNRVEQLEVENFEEDEGPIMFKFEPNYLSSLEIRRQEMARTRLILDTLDISENKRRKLLRDLYKNGLTKRLSKALVVENNYEDIEE